MELLKEGIVYKTLSNNATPFFIYYIDDKYAVSGKESLDEYIISRGFTIIDTKIRPIATRYVHLDILLE